jgi:hypothetical protein
VTIVVDTDPDPTIRIADCRCKTPPSPPGSGAPAKIIGHRNKAKEKIRRRLQQSGYGLKHSGDSQSLNVLNLGGEPRGENAAAAGHVASQQDE